MGVRIGQRLRRARHVPRLPVPELITIEDDVAIRSATVVVHDDAHRLDRIEPGAGDGTVAPVLGAGAIWAQGA
jgi:hypothetical protein